MASIKTVFFIGLPKSGSVAFGLLLAEFGFERFHDHTKAKSISDAAERGETSPLVAPDKLQVFADFVSFPNVAKLAELYPSAAFVWLDRPAEDQITSAVIHVLHSRSYGSDAWLNISTTEMRRELAAARETLDELADQLGPRLLRRPLNKLAAVDVANWLTELGVEIPEGVVAKYGNRRMPQEHSTEHKLNRLGVEPRYTQDFTTRLEDNFKTWLEPLIGRPGVSMTEVGCFEGRTSRWLLENILTDDSARLNCIDVWALADRSIERRFDRSIVASGASEKVHKLKRLSVTGLAGLPEKSQDAIYVDGSHEGRDALLDGLIAFRKLKPGGILIFDDYAERADWQRHKYKTTKAGVDHFLDVNGDRVEIIAAGYQLACRRLTADAWHRSLGNDKAGKG